MQKPASTNNTTNASATASTSTSHQQQPAKPQAYHQPPQASHQNHSAAQNVRANSAPTIKSENTSARYTPAPNRTGLNTPIHTPNTSITHPPPPAPAAPDIYGDVDGGEGDESVDYFDDDDDLSHFMDLEADMGAPIELENASSASISESLRSSATVHGQGNNPSNTSSTSASSSKTAGNQNQQQQRPHFNQPQQPQQQPHRQQHQQYQHPQHQHQHQQRVHQHPINPQTHASSTSSSIHQQQFQPPPNLRDQNSNNMPPPPAPTHAPVPKLSPSPMGSLIIPEDARVRPYISSDICLLMVSLETDGGAIANGTKQRVKTFSRHDAVSYIYLPDENALNMYALGLLLAVVGQG